MIILKKNYFNDRHNFIEKEILLTKQISQLQNNILNSYEDIENNKFIKFDRNEFNDFTIIKVNYAQPE